MPGDISARPIMLLPLPTAIFRTCLCRIISRYPARQAHCEACTFSARPRAKQN
ncbi:UNVERIFIED_CONTAM: hypothetical protein GTU68_022525 [Idotea baltica]|nr:hypothetical protein [Idotea baltica]